MIDSRTPRENPHFIGHRAAEDELAAAHSSGKLHHAWLITGPKGIGKATLAYRFARYLLAGGASEAGLFGDAPKGLQVDEHDPVFQRVAARGHGDLFSVERAYDEQKKRLRGEIVVGDVRGLGEFLSRTAAEGGWRIAIIDAADEMNVNAANAVLKVLEEPPRNAVILLVAHRPGRLLPTIRSRCRTLPLQPLSDDNVIELIGEYAPSLGDTERKVLTGLSDGSIGRALQLAEVGGVDLYDELITMLGSLSSMDVKALHEFSGRFTGAGKEEAFDTLNELLHWWIARMIRASASGRAPRALVDTEAPVLEQFASRQSPDRWIETLAEVKRLYGATKGLHLDKKQALLSTFFLLRNAAAG